jgi:hypothetical protein
MLSASLILAPFDGPRQDPARFLSPLDLLSANTHLATAPNEPFGLRMAPDPFERAGFCLRLDFLAGQRAIQYP